MSPSQKITAQDFEEAALSYEADAQKHLPATQAGSPFWKNMSMAASARLAVLSEEPDNQKALQSLYRFAKLHTFTPPALARDMSPVLDHYRQRVTKNDQDGEAHLMLAIATNILKGCSESYPGAAQVRKAAEIAPDSPAVCVEMAVCLVKTQSMWNPSTWGNKTKALVPPAGSRGM